MDYSSLGITVAIILYGMTAYRRRERLHRLDLACARRGEVPPPREPLHPRWKLASIACALLLIVVSEGLLIYMWSRYPRNFMPLAAIGAVFLLILIPLIGMFRRDFRRYRSLQRARGGAQ